MIDAQEKSKDVNEMNASSKKSLLKRVKALSQSLSVCLIPLSTSGIILWFLSRIKADGNLVVRKAHTVD